MPTRLSADAQYTMNVPAHAVSELDLQKIESVGHNTWKDICFFFLSAFLVSALNAASVFYTHQPEAAGSSVLLHVNGIIAIIALVAASISAVVWYQTYTSLKEAIARIKGQ